MNIKELIKDNRVNFDSYRQGNFYYRITDRKLSAIEGKDIAYLFIVPVDDIGAATLLSEDKAITFMRWIRRAIGKNALVRAK